MTLHRKESPTVGSKIEGRQSGNLSTFRTDTVISGGRHQGERTLERWVPDNTVDLQNSLNNSLGKSGGPWDQFAENKRLFGLTTDYNENFYTTTIDRNHPQYKQRVAEADRKAKEIERSSTNNPHVAEERILNNINETNSEMNEEDKYSSVRRISTIQSLSSSANNKYLPPARRAAVGQLLNNCAPTVPTAVLSQKSRSQKATIEKEASGTFHLDEIKPTKPENLLQITNQSHNFVVETRPNIATTSSNRKAPTQIENEAQPNATATVERDVASAFKNFASQQRKNVDQIRITRAKNDKEVKLNDLKAFATSFKLRTPVPSDLVPIIAKDPKKQKEIQAKAQRNAEKAGASKSNIIERLMTNIPLADPQVNKPTSQSQISSVSPSNVNNGQNNGHNINLTQGSTKAPSQNNTSMHQNRTSLNNRLKGPDQIKSNQLSTIQNTVNEPMYPRPNASTEIEANSLRSSVNLSSHGARLNPNSSEFRPSPHAASFNPSTVSSPQSLVLRAAQTPVIRSVLRRKPLSPNERPSIANLFNTLAFIKSLVPPTGKELAWKTTGGLRPAYDTQPVWKQATSEDKADSPIRLTYNKIFESAPFNAPIPSLNPPHMLPSLPQHPQQPMIHLSHVPHSLGSRQSPHQLPTLLYSNPQGSSPLFNGTHDDHRMISSHSAQSFVSPRLQNVPVAYPSPINQAAQLAYNPQMLQYSNVPQMQAGYRSLSNTHQFMPPQNPMGQMMIPNPTGSFMTSQNLGPGPQMMFPGAQPPPYIPATNGHPPMMPNVSGYPSPGRAVSMMVNQGSQQGSQQPIYGVNPGNSPGPNFGNPMFAQQPPIQMPIRPFSGPNSHSHGINSQSLHIFGPQNRRNNQNNGNFHPGKIFQHGQVQNSVVNNKIPVISQTRGPDSINEAK